MSGVPQRADALETSAAATLEAFLGTRDYHRVGLRSWEARLRNSLRPWLIRLPRRATAYRLETADGRRFKLMVGWGSGREALRGLEARLRALADFDRAPRLLWSSETRLLVEYVEGEPPSFEDPDFARQLGDGLAHLYRVHAGFRERENIRREYAEYARYLEDQRLFLEGTTDRVDAVVSALPERVPTGMVYGDLKRENFIVDPGGRVRFIDLGAYRDARILGLLMLGTGILHAIDVGAFRVGYREAGGDPFPLDHMETLHALSLVRLVTFEHRGGMRSGRLRGPRRGGRIAYFEDLLERARRQLERP